MEGSNMQAGSCKGARPSVFGAVLNSDIRLAFLVFALALLIRALNYDLLSGDFFLKYPAQAALYLMGKAEATRPFTASPLYLFYWIGVAKLLGGSVAAGRVLQILIGSANCALIAVLGKRLFTPATGLLAGLGAAFYLPFIVHDGSFVSASVVVFLNLCAMVLLERARWGSKVGLVAGSVALGLSATARLNVLIWAPFLGLWALWPRRDARPGSRSASWAWGGVFGLLVLMPPTLVTARNYWVGRDFVPVMSDGGIVFYLGNNEMDIGPMYFWPRYEDLFAILPGEVDPTHRIAQGIAERELGRPLKVSEASAFWMEQGLQFIRERPLQWAWLAVRKAAYTWTGYEAHDVPASFDKEEAIRARFPLPGFAVVGSLGLVGAFWFRRRFLDLLPLYGLLVTYTLTGVLFTVVCRYRIPMAPALLWFGAGFLASLPGTVRERGFRAVALPLVCAACLYGAMSYRSYPLRALTAQYRVENEHLKPAEGAMRSLRLDEAEAHLLATIEAGATYMTTCRAYGLLSRIYDLRGDHERADRYEAIGRGYRIDERWDGLLWPPRELAGDPVFEQWEVGARYFRDGQMAKAARAFAKLCNMVPNLASAQHCYGLALVRAGKTEAGLRRLRLARMKDPSNPATHWALIEFDPRPDTELLTEYRRLGRVHLERPGFRYGLALALRAAGQQAEGERELEHSCSAMPLDVGIAARAFARQIAEPS